MQTNQTQTAWVNILSKGIITIPKKIREKVGIKTGDIAEIRVEDDKIIIETRKDSNYRTFTEAEIKQWEKDDKLSKKMIKKIEELWPDLT